MHIQQHSRQQDIPQINPTTWDLLTGWLSPNKICHAILDPIPSIFGIFIMRYHNGVYRAIPVSPK